MPAKQSILNQIKKRKNLVGTKNVRRKKPIKILFPDSVEKEYASYLISIVRNIKFWSKKLISIELLVKEYNAEKSDRLDVWSNSAEKMIDQLRMTVEKNPVIQPLPLAEEIGAKTSQWNDNQWRRVMKSTIGVELFAREPILPALLKSFSMQNVALIKSLSDETLKNIEVSIINGINQGESHKRISKTLYGIDRGVFKKAETRAKLIARDQIAKLNGNLTMIRQQGVGVDEYIWRTSLDERVRKTHRDNEGKKFNWNRPPDITGHPGQDYQCRCTAEPVFPEEYFKIGR